MSKPSVAAKKPHRHLNIVRRLHELTTSLHVFKSRVEFAVLAYKYDLVSEITRYELWDAGFEGLGERQMDDCFEMGDCWEVVAEVMTAARKEGFEANIKRHIGEDSFAKWVTNTDRQGCLF